MKESPRRYTNPFLSDEENDEVNFWNDPELQNDDFINSNEDEKFRKPSEFLEKATGFYSDENVIECDLPELIVHCKESGFHDIKDICVDEGIRHEEKILIEGLQSACMDDCNMKADSCFGTKEKVYTELSVPEPTCDHVDMENDCEEHAPKACRSSEKSATDLYISRELKEAFKDDSDEDGSSKHVLPSENHGQEASTEQHKQERPLPSLEFVFKPSNNGVGGVNQQPCQSLVQDSSKRPPETEDLSTHHQTCDTSIESPTEGIMEKKPATSRDPHPVETTEPAHELSHQTQKPASENGEGESSFSMANPVSGHITCMASMAFSGSISLRSDSSTTSTRSFAFPILQTEWNSSPVRMTKAKQKRSQRWRQGLLCCKF